jgi:hypothetical protein
MQSFAQLPYAVSPNASLITNLFLMTMQTDYQRKVTLAVLLSAQVMLALTNCVASSKFKVYEQCFPDNVFISVLLFCVAL